MTDLYIDRLSFFSLYKFVFYAKEVSQIYYFNVSPGIKIFVELFTNLGLIKSQPQEVEFTLSDIKDKDGGSLYARIFHDIDTICRKIKEDELRKKRIIQVFGSHFNINKILLFFEKVIGEEIKGQIIYYHAALCHAEAKNGHNTADIICLAQKSHWSKYLSEYGEKLNIKTYSYLAVIVPDILKYLTLVKKSCISVAQSLVFRMKQKIQEKESVLKSQLNKNKNENKISSMYTAKPVTFNMKNRSDFFWFLGGDIPGANILIYFEKTHIPATQEMVSAMNTKGLKKIALSQKATITNEVPIWVPGSIARKERKVYFKLLFHTYLKQAIKMDAIPFVYVIYMTYFILKYAWWYDFFKSNNIKINFSVSMFPKESIPMNLALEKNGGVSVTYQYSSFSVVTLFHSALSDIYFSFGPDYHEMFKDSDSIVGHMLNCGYITDYAFDNVKEESRALRKTLTDQGAQYIICYFDENSSNNTISLVPNSRSASIYKKLLDLVLTDETIGLICSPKYPNTLLKRVPEIIENINRAKETGRLIFMDGKHHADNYPTEASQAADLCVGLLLGGTTCLESFLSGTPTVFLDMEKIYSNPIYTWGRGKVVFDNLDDFVSALLRHRQNPEIIPGFGDLSLWVENKDPFKDGKAHIRIGQYLNWLLTQFNEGKQREEIIAYANKKYSDSWGKENVIAWH